MKYHWKIISLIIHLKINEYLLKYFHWHLSDIELSLQSVSSISLKFQCSFQTVHLGPGGIRTRLRREGGRWGDPVRRLDRHSGTLYSNPLCSVQIAFRYSIFSYFLQSLLSNDFRHSLFSILFTAFVFLPRHRHFSIHYLSPVSDRVSLFRYRTGSGIGISFYSITGLTGYRTVRHSGVQKNCTKGGGSVRVQRISESAV